MTVRTRFAPSPTGHLHIGGIRTALYSWLEARRHGGQFILRVEDTDQERSTQAATEVILEGMHWLGLDPDEGPFFQSQRFDRYRQVTEQLLDQGKAYHCWCSQDDVNQMREEQREKGVRNPVMTAAVATILIRAQVLSRLSVFATHRRQRSDR